MKVLFVCYSHQRDYFLTSHAECINNRGGEANFLILDEGEEGSSRSRKSLVTIPSHLIKLRGAAKALKPDMVISITPKAGLVVAIYGVLFGSNAAHIHWFTGQVWCNFIGFKRWIYKSIDTFICSRSSRTFVDGVGQRDFLLNCGFKERKLIVNGEGSIGGVEDSFFSTLGERKKNTEDSKLRIGVVGRICPDKGIQFILDNFSKSILDEKNAVLHFFGEFDNCPAELICRFNERVISGDFIFHGTIREPDIYANIDILLLASYREGFSNVILEAQAFGVPVLSRNIYAVTTSLVDTKSGFLFNDIKELIGYIEKLSSASVRDEMGAYGNQFAEKNFKRSHVVNLICDAYEDSLGNGQSI
jgi:glycosyltransferase involved in cell wall biosynthesis